jgi:GDP-L-fucose synthase
MKRAFVTGGGGFLGQTVVPRLREAGFEVDAPGSKYCDLRRRESLDRFSKHYDYIFHLAAWTQAGDFCLHHQGEQWIINQQINTNILSWWRETHAGARAVFIGTSCAYDPNLPLSEENYLVGEPIDSLYTYAMTKRMMEVGARSLGQQFGMKSMTLVPSTLCGSYYHTDGRQMHFIYDVIRKILDHKRTGSRVVLWGDGTQKREILRVDDFVSGMLRLLDVEEAWDQVINLGAGCDYSIREFAAEGCRICGVDPTSLEFDTTKYVGAKAKRLETKKVSHLIPWKPSGIQEAVSEVVRALSGE